MSALRRLIARRARPEVVSDTLLAHADPADQRIAARALQYSFVGVPRMLALIDSVRYCVSRGVPGAFVECGVWRGGSVLAMILTLQELSAPERDIYLYDTFEGMTEPTKLDTSAYDRPALETWRDARREQRRPWSELFDPVAFNQNDVRAMLLATDYPERLLHFVAGPVERTIPGTSPDEIAVLRLDTDWYESTRHELTHLFPLLVAGGVLIVDDYGHWEGARKAVDEYFAGSHPPLLLNRIDYTGRIAVKQ